MRIGVSKQAIAKLIDDIERLGYVHRLADSGDGRAKKVVLTDRGKALLMAGADVRNAIESQLSAALPEAERTSIHATLGTMVAILDGKPSPERKCSSEN